MGEGLRSETDRPTLTKAEIFLALVDLAKEPTVRTKLVRKLTRPAGRRTAAAHGAGGSKRHKDANG